jgi:hypothetical protein
MASRKRKLRVARTIVLGIVAVVALFWGAIDIVGADVSVLIEALLTSIATLFLVVAAAAITVLVWQTIKRWLAGSRSDD